MEWRSAKTDKPNSHADVLGAKYDVSVEGGWLYYLVAYDHKKGEFYDFSVMEYVPITYWCYIQEPPNKCGVHTVDKAHSDVDNERDAK